MENIPETEIEVIKLPMEGRGSAENVSFSNKPAVLIKRLFVLKNGREYILKNINFEARFGEKTAIMGPSGSGKTSLLRYLADFRSSNLKYSGEKVIVGNYKYVPQEDRLHGFMTVDAYMNNYFGLNYGLQSHTNVKEREKLKNTILQEMNITKTKNTKVGDTFFKGISGGERRRLSISLELVSKPGMLILDEPTSGLDSFAAEKIMQALKTLVTHQKTAVVLTIHQPSSRIFKLIDKIVLLKKGEIKYHGPGREIGQFFHKQGQREWEKFNPADQIMELLGAETVNAVEYELEYSEDEVKRDRKTIKKNQALRGFQLNYRRASKFEKFLFLTLRYLMSALLNPAVIGFRILIFTLLGTTLGLLMRGNGEEVNYKTVSAKILTLFGFCSFEVFLSIAALPPFIIERAIVEKEVGNGLYHPILYQLANMIMNIIGCLIMTFISGSIVAILVGLQNIWVYLAILFLANLIAEAGVVLFSILTPHFIIATAIIAFIYGAFMLSSGFLVLYSRIPSIFVWIYHIAFHTYSLKALLINEFGGVDKIDGGEVFTNSKELLAFYGVEYDDITIPVVNMICYWLGVQILISLALIIKFRKTY